MNLQEQNACMVNKLHMSTYSVRKPMIINKFVKMEIAKKARKWTDTEVKKILEYIIEEGNFEKPTCQIYYKELVRATNLNAGWNLVRWKVRNLKRTYIRALEWKKTNAAATTINGDPNSKLFPKTFRHFGLLSQIFGTIEDMDDIDSHEFVDINSIESTNNMEENHCLENLKTEPETDCSYIITSVDNIVEPTALKSTFIARNSLNLEASTAPTILSSTASTSHAAAATSHGAATSPVPPTPKPAISSNKLIKNASKTAVQQLISLQAQRMKFYHKKLDIENRKLDIEERKSARELKLQEEKQKQEFEIRKLELEKSERIARYEIEMKYKSEQMN